MENEEKNYAQLIAAQNESARRLKIKSVTNTLSDENKKKTIYSFISAICFSGLLISAHESGIAANEALKTEISALSSFDSLKEYLKAFTPAMWGTLVATAVSFTNYLKHSRKYDNANREFYDLVDTEPTDYLDVVASQARSK